MTSDTEFKVVVLGVALMSALLGFWAGTIAGRSDSAPAEPQYDVNRVVKMHEEARQCAVELEEARDNVLVCGRLLKRALE